MNITIPSPTVMNSPRSGASAPRCHEPVLWPSPTEAYESKMPTEEFILAPGLETFMPRQPSMGWWTIVEHRESEAQMGARFLVRQDHVDWRGVLVTVDYISTRVDTAARWSRQTVAYKVNEASPYPIE